MITGGQPLTGPLAVSGSKNTALALMTGALLGNGPQQITNLPGVQDVRTLAQIIEYTGAMVNLDVQAGLVTVDPTSLKTPEAPYELVKKMRASFYMLGALLGRCGKARVSLPGGCAWGPRPVDLHLKGIEALGAKIDLDEGYVQATAPTHPNRLSLWLAPFSSSPKAKSCLVGLPTKSIPTMPGHV